MQIIAFGMDLKVWNLGYGLAHALPARWV